MNLFVYGELTRAAVLRSVIGRLPFARTAVLAGHARRPDPAGGFFAATEAPGAEVAGLLLLDLDAREMALLDEYEGVAEGQYLRVTVSVRAVEPAQTIPAEVYLAGATVR